MHAIRVIVVKDPQTNTPKNKRTHTQTHRQDRLQYTASQLASAQCNKLDSSKQFTVTYDSKGP